MKKGIVFGILFLVIVLALIFVLQKTEFAGVDIPIEDSARLFHTTKLDNGLTITVKEIHTLPLVTIQFWVKTGSINENDANRGIAHVFEHIWFKGTPSQPAGSFDRMVSSYGGKVNAMTAQDYTAFHVTVPSEKFKETLKLMADLFKNQLFDPVEIEKEKLVILEEQKMIQNEPSMFADENFGLLLAENHPYRHPILGYTETISATTPESIKAFYEEWYVPNNMNLVVIGDVDKDIVAKEAQIRFGRMESKDLPVVILPDEPLQAGIKYETKTRKGLGNSYAALGYKTIGFQDDDWYVLRVLTQILDGSENSRIQKNVKTDKELISSSETYFTPLKDFGAIETLLVFDPLLEDEVIKAVLEEYNKLKKERVSNAELESAKKQLFAGYAQDQEELFQQGSSIGRWWAAGKFSRQPYYLEDIDKVSKDDILNVAKKYFRQPIIFVLRPE